MSLFFVIAGVMALFGVMGYKRGFWPMLVSLGILFFATLLIGRSADMFIAYMNGIWLGIQLLFKSGVKDLSEGNLESAKAKLSSIEKPFTDANEQWAYLLVIAAAVVGGLLITMLMKSKPSVWGLLVGLLYGYVLCAALLPIFLGAPWAILPIFPATPNVPGGSCQGLWNRMVCVLANPENARICGGVVVVSVAVFLIIAIRQANKSVKRPGARNGGSSKGSEDS